MLVSFPRVNSIICLLHHSGCERVAVEDEKCDFKDKEFREEAENDKNRITWNIERRCYLEPSARAT